MRKIILIILLGLGNIYFSELKAQVSQLFASGDAFVSASSPTINYGKEKELLLKSSTAGDYNRKFYLQFDLTGQSTSSKQILLKLVIASGEYASEIVRSVSSTSWNENTLTWNNKPADGNPIEHGGYKQGDTIWVDITSYIKSKISSNQLNVSFEIYSDDIVATPMAINSLESNTPKNAPSICFYNCIKYDITSFRFLSTTASVVDKGEYPATNIYDISTSSKLDIYGGFTKLKFSATGYFRTEKVQGVWYLADPLGNMFYTVGLNSVETGGGINLPSSIISMGVNTMGNWSDQSISKIPYCPILNILLSFKNSRQDLKDLYALDILPVFDADFVNFCNTFSQNFVSQYVNNPWVFGYFLDNELPFYKDQLKASLNLSNSNAQWKAADAWMKTKYGNSYTISQITTANEEEYQGYVTEKYYKVTTQAIKTYDKNHLIIGSRFHGAAIRLPYIMSAAGKYTDIISVNYYGKWEPDYGNLDMWLAQGNKPFLISEFYTRGDDTGLANANGAGWNVKTQQDRAIFYENFTLKLLNHPGCVGWHWFRYIDNNQTNKGVISEQYTWYTPLVNAFKNINLDVYSLRSHMLFGNSNFNELIKYTGSTCDPITTSINGNDDPIVSGNYYLYPNPTSGKITLCSNNNSGIPSTKISILNSQGLEVFNENMDTKQSKCFTFDFSFLANGIYLIRIENQCLKFIKY